jgi:thioredoxin 1
MNQIIEVPGAQFEREMRTATQPVLVYFYTSWSGQSQFMGPLVDALAGQLGGELSIRKASLDHQPELARRYRITEVPALVLFDNGASVASFAGAISSHELKAHLQGLLADYTPLEGSGGSL